MAKSPDDRFKSAAEMMRYVQQLRKPVKQAGLMTSVSTGAVAIAGDMVRVVQQLRISEKYARLMAWVSPRAVKVAEYTAYFAKQLQKSVRHAWQARRVPTGAVAGVLGIGVALLIGQSLLSDNDENQAVAGTTVSEVVVAESAPAIAETPEKEPAKPVTETVATQAHNEPQTPVVVAISEAAIPESSSDSVEMASAESADPVTETPVPVNTNEQQIEKLLSQAAAALKAYRLTKPNNNNARDYYQQILDLDPQHEKALQGFSRIADAYADLAERKLNKFDYEATKKYVHRGLTIQPKHARLLGLKEKANTGTILAQADTALKEYRLTKPKNNNAYDYYQQVLESQPQHEKALEGITGVANAYADLAEVKLDKFEYKEARAYVDRGLTVQPDNTRLLALQKDTNAFRDAPKRMWKKFLSPFSKAQ